MKGALKMNWLNIETKLWQLRQKHENYHNNMTDIIKLSKNNNKWFKMIITAKVYNHFFNEYSNLNVFAVPWQSPRSYFIRNEEVRIKIKTTMVVIQKLFCKIKLWSPGYITRLPDTRLPHQATIWRINVKEARDNQRCYGNWPYRMTSDLFTRNGVMSRFCLRTGHIGRPSLPLLLKTWESLNLRHVNLRLHLQLHHRVM